MTFPAKKLAKTVTIVNELGLHARAAAKLAMLARKAGAGFWLEKDGQKIDAGSVIDILTLACPKGSQIMLIGDDTADHELFNQIVELIADGFEE
jgi:phosphocarrier protein HPr